MAIDGEAHTAQLVTAARSGFGGLPLKSRLLIVAVVSAALALTLVGRWQVDQTDWRRFGLVLALSISYSLLSRRLEKIRRALGEGLVPDLHGAWVVAGSILLPNVLIALLTVALFASELPVRRLEHRAGSSRRQPVYKLVYTVAAVALPAELAHLLGSWLHGAGLVVAVSMTVVIINNGLIIAAITLSGQRQKIGLFTDSITRQLVDVMSTLVGASLGVLAAGGSLLGSSFVLILGVPAFLILQHVSVAVESRQPTVLDPTSGLLSASRLGELAQLELATGRQCTVIVIQILADSDAEIRAAAGVIRECIQTDSQRERLIGRCDAATFAVVLPGIRPEYGAWYRGQVHKELDSVGLPHLVALGYPLEDRESFHSIVMRVGAMLVASLPPATVPTEG